LNQQLNIIKELQYEILNLEAKVNIAKVQSSEGHQLYSRIEFQPPTHQPKFKLIANFSIGEITKRLNFNKMTEQV
jgi:hypothetical protein